MHRGSRQRDQPEEWPGLRYRSGAGPSMAPLCRYNARGSERGERILIVDDEAGIRSTLSGILEDEGYAVAAVGTAAEATARLRAGAFARRGAGPRLTDP